jgi:hypothetical protein
LLINSRPFPNLQKFYTFTRNAQGVVPLMDALKHGYALVLAAFFIQQNQQVGLGVVR